MKIPITSIGAELLRAELHRLKTVERHAVITAIAEARAQGDITENAEYEAARERQGFIEGRIIELESKLSNAQIIDPTLLDDDDLKLAKISYSSPIAKALIGKSSGDVAEVRTPGGVKEFEIVDVKYL